MRQALYSQNSTEHKQGNPSIEWKVLPCLSCQAAGGNFSWAEGICVAWSLFHNAARIMDNIEDNEGSKNFLNSDISLTAATGLFFSAQYALNKLSQDKNTQHVASEINLTFTTKLLQMCEGQYQDITNKTPNLEQYWQIAEKKSGSFFSIATNCGARLATNDPQKIWGFDQYGFHLGLLIQLLDDLEDIYFWLNSSVPQSNLLRSLPVIYFMEVASENDKNQLKEYFNDDINCQSIKEKIMSLLEKCGAVLYLSSEIERHSGLALAGLENANALSPALEKLNKIINSLTPTF